MWEDSWEKNKNETVLTIDVHFGKLRLVKYTIEFNREKNLILKETRGVDFEDVIDAYECGQVLDDLKSKNHPQQRILVIRIKEYVYAVPYVMDRKKKVIFLKTIYPSRVLVKKYIKEKK